MSPRAAGAVALVLLVALGLAGCPGHVRIERPYPPPTASSLRELVRTRQEQVQTLNGRVRATSWMGGERVKATVLVLAERPGRLRLEAEVTLQGTVAVLATDGVRFAFLDTRQNELRRGPACPANVASLIRIPLAPQDVAAILLGDGPPVAAAAADDDQVTWDADLGADVLDVAGPSGGRIHYAIRQLSDHRIQIAALAVVTASSGQLWRVAFEDFTDVRPSTSPTAPPLSLPETIHFAEATASFDEGVEIHFKDRTLNEPSPPEAFILTAPPNTPTIEVPCP